MLQEEGVDLLIGDSSLCAVMPEVFFLYAVKNETFAAVR